VKGHLTHHMINYPIWCHESWQSGDMFHEMLHIKCSVQAQFSTAVSYLVAKTESTKPSNIEQDAVTSLKEHKIIALIWYTPSVLW